MPSNNPNVQKNLAPKWSKGQSGNPKGRPPKMDTILKQYFLDEHNLKLTKTIISGRFLANLAF